VIVASQNCIFLKLVSQIVFLSQRLLYVDAEDELDEHRGKANHHHAAGDASSDDDDDDEDDDSNDSTAAAHAAATGLSPQLKPHAKQGDSDSDDDETATEGKDAVVEDVKLPAAKAAESNRPEDSTAAKEVKDGDAMDVDEPANGDAKVATTRTSPPNSSARQKSPQINRAININERDVDENTALHIAIHARKKEHVKLLLEAGASFRMKCDGSWPLHTAISLGALRAHRQFAYDCVVLLRESGADLTTKDDSLYTPLFLACMFNLPQIASYILSDEEGETTINTRADRAGNRPLHAAAKFDTAANPSFSKTAAASATGQVTTAPHHHHPDGTVVNALHTIPRFNGGEAPVLGEGVTTPAPAHSAEALLTQLLLGTNGIEIDALNMMGQTPLHTACQRGNWPVARLLLEAGADSRLADRRGYTPGQLAFKRGLFIPPDLGGALGDPPETGVVPPLRDLIVDADSSTLLLCHELCFLHRTCPPMRRDSSEPPPENVKRLTVLVDEDTGILRSGEFGNMVWEDKARRAAIGDVLKCHEYTYVESISQVANQIPDLPNAIAHLDPDTAISHWSFEAAMRAAGSVCGAVDKVFAGEHRNAFCAVRPPGHHAGPRGIVRCANDPEGGSHGFCLLNNVAIGAAYARCMYRNEGIRKVAIIDFDVHHGNGTEEIIRNLIPSIEKTAIRTPFALGELSISSYRPWLDESDIQNVFFSSTHGYGHRGQDQMGWFYPASGKTHISEAITHPAMIENPGLADFLLSQTWSRMGEDSKANCCKIINVGLDLPDPDADPQTRSMKQRIEFRDTYRHKIFPALREFDPDIIFISAGFDAHRKDTMNFGYVGMVEDDYEWVTENLVKIANTCCNGRLVSVLEGGYKIQGGIISPFARSVASHVRALVDGGKSRELYDSADGEWESTFEHNLFEKRERKKEQEREQLRTMEEAHRQNMLLQIVQQGGVPEDPDAPSRKRRRNQVDYKELFKQMQHEGFGN
jgi:acetoin utilization deacetylase AcuC-like enzyme/ankyrin repeat protein